MRFAYIKTCSREERGANYAKYMDPMQLYLADSVRLVEHFDCDIFKDESIYCALGGRSREL